jgi:acetyl-CoA carboxylase / biotin carboxylase 1
VISISLLADLSKETTDGGGCKVDDDNELAAEFGETVRSCASELVKHSVSRVSVLVVKSDGNYPLFFTYRCFDGFNEDAIIRHLEPAHAFQLELDRLTNFSVTPVQTTNKSIYIYHATGRQNPADSRLFTRLFNYSSR